MQQTFVVHELSCGSCEEKIRAALQPHTQIKNVSINIAKKTIALTVDTPLRASDLSALLPNGYTATEAETKTESSFLPLIIILCYVLLSGVLFSLAQIRDMDVIMRSIMGFFFIYFSLFKLLDIRGFVHGFATYDPIAKRVNAYGYVYPFIELLLGISYLVFFFPILTPVITLLTLGITLFGVLSALRKKRRIQCACLGTMLKLPLTKVTIAENTIMILMALILLF